MPEITMATKPRTSGAATDEQASAPADEAVTETTNIDEAGDDPVDPVQPINLADEAVTGGAGEACNPYSALIGGETIIRMTHPGGGTSDRYASDGDAILVPAADVPEMRDHGCVIAAAEA
jgi:hypothetical protein